MPSGYVWNRFVSYVPVFFSPSRKSDRISVTYGTRCRNGSPGIEVKCNNSTSIITHKTFNFS